MFLGWYTEWLRSPKGESETNKSTFFGLVREGETLKIFPFIKSHYYTSFINYSFIKMYQRMF